jgi:Ser/Thr protein kinase RdoA (MazF antagonist)
MKEKNNFNVKRIEKLLQKNFPNSKLISYRRFKAGLVSPAYKVKITNPKKEVVVKIAKLKRKSSLETSNRCLEHLHEKGIPSPRIYFSGLQNRQFITIMDFVHGNTALEVFKKSNLNIKKRILRNAGKELKKIHSLKIPSFWIHHRHEIKTSSEWRSWTNKRIVKYVEFIKNKWPDLYPGIEKELDFFRHLLKTSKFSLVALHWDYHLSNMNVSKQGLITGIFDLDNAMKGHNLADIGQTAYWLHNHLGSNQYLKFFLEGYKSNKLNFSNKELNLIKGYEILHILAITRTIWFRQKRLGWLIKKHKKMLKEILN